MAAHASASLASIRLKEAGAARIHDNVSMSRGGAGMLMLRRPALGFLAAVSLGTVVPTRDEPASDSTRGATAAHGARILSWGDQGDGTYTAGRTRLPPGTTTGRPISSTVSTWGEDDWPVFGDGGQAVERWKKPGVGHPQPVSRPTTSDEFDAPALSPQWQRNHNPVPEAWSLSARPGWLRLEARPASDLSRARNTLTQKLWDEAGVVDVHLDVRAMANSQRAGLTFVSGSTFGWVGVRMGGGSRRGLWEQGEGPQLFGEEIWLRGRYAGDTARLEYSLDGRTYVDTGLAFPLRFGHWKGARVGVFSYGEQGYVDADYVRYVYSDQPLPDPDAR
jgi:beta-xylosidase